jgi:hypothetical protein
MKCITCKKEVISNVSIKKYGEYFCDTNCLSKYEADVEKLKNELSLDDCC